MGKVITVTREFGSMGRLIAKLVAEKLNFNYYDRDIIELAAKEFRGNIDELSGFEDKKLSIFGKMMYPLGLGSAAMQNKVYEMEKSVILDLARTEDCVIVGRCSDHLLRSCGHKEEELLNIFIYAPYEARLVSCKNELNLNEAQAKKYIEGVDKARSEFYKLNTGESFYSNKYRHLMLDSSMVARDVIVDTIASIAKEKFHLN